MGVGDSSTWDLLNIVAGIESFGRNPLFMFINKNFALANWPYISFSFLVHLLCCLSFLFLSFSFLAFSFLSDLFWVSGIVSYCVSPLLLYFVLVGLAISLH